MKALALYQSTDRDDDLRLSRQVECRTRRALRLRIKPRYVHAVANHFKLVRSNTARQRNLAKGIGDSEHAVSSMQRRAHE